MSQDRDEPKLTVQQLLAGYARTLAELRRRNVVRSNNAPAGDYAEWLVATALGGQLVPNSTKSSDVTLPDSHRIQVKARVVSEPLRTGQLQTSPFRSWDFDEVALVQLRDHDYRVLRAVLLPVSVARANSQARAHVNGEVLYMRPALLNHPEAQDITDALNRAAASA